MRALVAACLVLLASCVPADPVPQDCEPACGADETCSEGSCIALCEPACEAGQTCIEGACVSSCEPACEGDQTCIEGACVAPCAPACEGEQTCLEGACVGCALPCEDWQQCSGTVCETRAGRCAADLDCDTACDLSTHLCTPAGCHPACEPGEVCEGDTCVPQSSGCTKDADCPAEAPQCSAVTGVCGPRTEAARVLAPVTEGEVILTREALRAAFEPLAALHTLTGTPTRLVTVEEVCAAATCDDADPRSDTAKAIKAWVMAQPGLGHLVLGGDVELVPSREVYDEFSVAALGYNYAMRFATDYYYADFSQWDGNGDGEYAQDGVDAPDYRPEISVSRIPASTAAEAEGYVAKARAHLVAYDTSRVRSTLLLTNVATTRYVFGFPVDIDGAQYFEMDGRTADLLPGDFAVKKLYATYVTAGSERLSLTKEIAELQAGHNLVVHNGHGSEGVLTTDPDGSHAFDKAAAEALRNDRQPFFLSCACQAGNFAFADHDSAGEALVLNPLGGAIGYLGNTAVGLGLAGGSQLIDELLRHALDPARLNPMMGEALRAAHQNMPTRDSIELSGTSVPVVDQSAYEWTQKAVVYLGDGLLPIWTDPALLPAPALEATREVVPGGARLTFETTPGVDGVLELQTATARYEVTVSGGGTVLVELPEAAPSLRAALRVPGRLPAYLERSF